MSQNNKNYQYETKEDDYSNYLIKDDEINC